MARAIDAKLPPRWMNGKQVQRALGISKDTLWRWRKKRKIDYRRIGNKIYYPREAVYQFS